MCVFSVINYIWLFTNNFVILFVPCVVVSAVKSYSQINYIIISKLCWLDLALRGISRSDQLFMESIYSYQLVRLGCI